MSILPQNDGGLTFTQTFEEHFFSFTDLIGLCDIDNDGLPEVVGHSTNGLVFVKIVRNAADGTHSLTEMAAINEPVGRGVQCGDVCTAAS